MLFTWPSMQLAQGLCPVHGIWHHAIHVAKHSAGNRDYVLCRAAYAQACKSMMAWPLYDLLDDAGLWEPRTWPVVGGVVHKHPVHTITMLVEVGYFLHPTGAHVQGHLDPQILSRGIQVVAHAIQIPVIQQQTSISGLGD